MKRLLIMSLVVSVFLTACGQSLNTQEVTQTETKMQSAQAQQTQNEQPQLEQPTPPTERTVDTNGEYPWFYYGAEHTKQLHEDGETVYLVSDAEPLETYISDFSVSNPQDIPKETVALSWANYLDAFLNEVDMYMPVEYLTKMEEVENALRSYNYDVIPQLINEASELRQ